MTDDVVGSGEWEELEWEDVKNVELPAKLVWKGKQEEVDFYGVA